VYYVDAGLPASYSGSGNTWNDLSGSGLTTTLYGSPEFSNGALSFVPSKSQYASTASALPLLPNWTVETWHYYDNTNTVNPKYPPTLVTDMFMGNAMNFVLGRWNTTVPTTLTVGYYLNPHTPNWFKTTPDSSLAVGWYHIVGTFDGASLKLWLNNVNANTTPSATPCKAGGKGIYLMRNWAPDAAVGDYFWGGKLAVVRIYNKALSSTEITQNYNAGKARFGL
jgi:hypothetical protein